jgi:hypothetical protein
MGEDLSGETAPGQEWKTSVLAVLLFCAHETPV